MPRSDTLTWSDFGDHIFICRSKTSAHIFMIYDDLINLIMIYMILYVYIMPKSVHRTHA